MVPVVIFTTAFPTLRMGYSQANLAHVHEKYFVFHERRLQLCSYLTFFFFFFCITRFLNLKKSCEFLVSVSQMVVFCPSKVLSFFCGLTVVVMTYILSPKTLLLIPLMCLIKVRRETRTYLTLMQLYIKPNLTKMKLAVTVLLYFNVIFT